MKPIKLSLDRLARTAAHRPAGYFDAVLAAAERRDAQWAWVPAAAHAALGRQFNPTRQLYTPPKTSRLFDGSKLWAEIHRRALAYVPGPTSADRELAWLRRGVMRRLPCGECRREWRAILRETPPDLSGAAGYFAWTVEAHNRVNRKLGKAEWTAAGQPLLGRAGRGSHRRVWPVRTGGGKS